MTHEELRLEFNRPLFKQLLRDNLGDKCVNCNSDYKVEYHHIVPLALGGTNRLSNIVPLCYQCHKAAHNGRHMTQYAKNSKNTGRPNKVSYEDAEPILDLYFSCIIGTAECIERLGYSKKTHMQDIPHHGKYKKENSILASKNRIDIIVQKNNGEMPEDGREIGYIKYPNYMVTWYEGRVGIFDPFNPDTGKYERC